MTRPHVRRSRGADDPESSRSDAGARTVLVAVAGTLIGGAPVWLVASLAPQLQADLRLDPARLGLAVGLNFAVLAVCAVSAGRLVDRIGWRRGMVLTALGSSLALLGIAVGARSWPALAGLLCLGALAASLSHPASNVGIAETVGAGRQGIAFGVKQASVPLTTLLAGLASPLVAGTVGWRWAFGGAGALALLLLLTLLSAGPAYARRAGLGAASAGAREVRAGPPASDASRRSLVVLAVGAGLVAAATLRLGSFLVLSAVDAGMGVDSAGLLLSLGSAVGIVSRIAQGHLADRRGSRHLLVVVQMVLGGSVGLLVLAVGRTPWRLVLGTLLAFGLGWSWNGLFAMVVVVRNPRSPAFATGAVQTALATGGIVGPPAFGLVAGAWSFPAAWTGAAVVNTAGALLLLAGRRLLQAPADVAGTASGVLTAR